MEEYRGFDQNGQLWIRVLHSRGVREGECKVWRSNGRLEEQKFYKRGVPEGKWKHWYVNGRPQSLEHYINGAPDGEYKSWLQDGRLSAHQFYRNGCLVDSKLHVTTSIFSRIKKLKFAVLFNSFQRVVSSSSFSDSMDS